MGFPWCRSRPAFQSLHDLLASPDPSDLIGRGHRITQPGDPQRRSTVLLPLLTRWAVTRQVLNDAPPFIGKARKGFKLRIADRRRA